MCNGKDLQAVGPEPAVALKPLEWRDLRERTFPPMWSASTVCGVYDIEERCASDTPAYVVLGPLFSFIADKDSLVEAKAAAEADYASRIRSALVATPPAEPVVEALRSEAGAAYCRFLDKMSAPLCLGVEHKLETGEFGAAELNAHVDARELYGFHRGINHALAALAAKDGRS